MDTYELLPVPSERSISEKAKRAGQITAKEAAAGFGGTYGDLLSLLGLAPQEIAPGQKALTQAEHEIAQTRPELLPYFTDEDIAPRYTSLPTSQSIREMIGGPEAETALERYLGRAGQTVGSLGSFAAANALRPGVVGSVLGQTVEEAGGGPLAQFAAELLPFVAGGTLQPRLAPSKAQKPLIEAGRRHGISEQSLAALTPSKTAEAIAAKFAPRNEKMARNLAKLSKETGNAYEFLKTEAEGLGKLDIPSQASLAEQMDSIIERAHKSIKHVDPQRKNLMEVLGNVKRDIARQDLSYDDLIDIWQAMNSAINWNKIKAGNALIGDTKRLITGALESKSPQVADDFGKLNELYKRGIQTRKRFAPSLSKQAAEHLLNLGENAALVYGTITGNPKIVTKAAALMGGRALARELMFNPKYRNLGNKFVDSIIKNEKTKSAALLKTIDHMIRKDHPPNLLENSPLQHEPADTNNIWQLLPQ